ncbi:DnaA N-terminal domain-containing protein, partial [Verrucomicrobiota bacterium]
MSDSKSTDLWNSVCKQLREVLHPDAYSRWIAVIEPVSLNDSTITLSVENDFYQTWLEDNYLPLIHRALAASAGSEVQTCFVVRPSREPAQAEPQKKPTIRERLSRRFVPQPDLNPKFTF